MAKRPLKNWGGSNDDSTFKSLVSALHGSGWDLDDLHDIVNAMMLFASKASGGKAGIVAFHGGHVRLSDSKRFYKAVQSYVANGSTLVSMSTWVPVVGMTPRGGNRSLSQSHPSDDSPYEVTMPMGWGCILVGTKEGGSWFQTEATSVKRGWGSMAYHTAKDFAAYKATGLQQGPAGTSDHSDKNPLKVDTSACNEICKQFLSAHH
jgi:hypothetical protein